MNKAHLFFFLLFFLFPSFTSAMGIQGMILKDQFFFEPGLERSYDLLFSTNSGFTQDYELYARMYDETSPGDLSPYVTIDKYYVKGVPSGSAVPFNVHLKLPQEINTPGIYEIRAGARETQSLGGGNMGVRTAAEMRIIVIVLNPAEYALVTFSASNVNENETANFQFTITNYGKPPIIAKGKVEIMPLDSDLLLGVARTDDTEVKSMESKTVLAPFTTNGISPGIYRIRANLSWSKDNFTEFNTTFNIGTRHARVTEYTTEFVKDAINKMQITAQSDWNNKMMNVYADVTIFDSSKKSIQTFRTISVDLPPWRSEVLTGYFDTKGLAYGNYSARIQLHYEGASSITEGTISITPGAEAEILQKEKPEAKKNGLPGYVIVLFSIIGVLLIALIIIVFLLIKRR